jgi:hypothetical protein
VEEEGEEEEEEEVEVEEVQQEEEEEEEEKDRRVEEGKRCEVIPWSENLAGNSAASSPTK